MKDTNALNTTSNGAEGLRLDQSVYEQITQMIISGELETGLAISESELSRRLEVSRTPVHEAINRLAKDGLIIQQHNRRPLVASFDTEDIFDVYEMRRILEREAAAKAATRIDSFTLSELQKAAEQYRRCQDQPSALRAWVEFDDKFHAAIAAACGSKRLQADIERYRLLHRVFNRTHTNPGVLVQAYAEHLKILDALRNRDAAAAHSAMDHHIAEWQRFFVKHLQH